MWADPGPNTDDSLTNDMPSALAYDAMKTDHNSNLADGIVRERNTESERSDLSLLCNEKLYHGKAPGEKMYDYLKRKCLMIHK